MAKRVKPGDKPFGSVDHFRRANGQPYEADTELPPTVEELMAEEADTRGADYLDLIAEEQGQHERGVFITLLEPLVQRLLDTSIQRGQPMGELVRELLEREIGETFPKG